MKTVTSTVANREFSRLLRDVAQGGEPVQITSRGRAVAMLGPADAREPARRQLAKAQLLARLAQQAADSPVSTPRDWTRDELYD
jgi:prevent-host-death family protein